MPKRRPTQRAPDLGWAPRFSGFFLASAESRFDADSTPYPKRVTQTVSPPNPKDQSDHL